MKALARSLLLCMLMLGAAGTGVVLRPHQRIADMDPKIVFATLIPQRFGDWVAEPISTAQIVDPLQKALIKQLYSQTLTRTYINSQGYRVMLSIAYGSDQSDGSEVHKPEVCYPAQGFVLHDRHSETLQLGSNLIPVVRLFTSLGERKEPITYWIMIGETPIGSGGFDKKLAELSYGFRGKIPDGTLIRASSIDADVANAYAIQDQFLSQMLDAIPLAMRTRLAGKPASKKS